MEKKERKILGVSITLVLFTFALMLLIDGFVYGVVFMPLQHQIREVKKEVDVLVTPQPTAMLILTATPSAMPSPTVRAFALPRATTTPVLHSK